MSIANTQRINAKIFCFFSHKVFAGLLVSFLFFVTLSQSFAQTVHLILVSDVAEQKFTVATRTGRELMKGIFQTISNELYNKPALEYYVSNSLFNADDLKASVAKVNSKEGDIIVFYYTGWGTFKADGSSNFPVLRLSDFDKKSLDLDDIGNLLKAKPAHLRLVLGDFRNNKVELEIPTIPKPNGRSTDIKINLNKQIIGNLINTSCGLITLSSHGKGASSAVITRTILTKIPGTEDKYTSRQDENEYSVFSLAFSDVFERILKKENTKITFPEYIRSVQFRMNLELNPIIGTFRTQTLVQNKDLCNYKAPEKDLTKLPKTFKNLDEQLEYLYDITDIKERAEQIKKIGNWFTFNDNITFTVNRAVKSETKIELVKVPNTYTSLARYLNTLSKYNPKLQSVKIWNSGSTTALISENVRLVIELEEYYNE